MASVRTTRARWSTTWVLATLRVLLATGPVVAAIGARRADTVHARGRGPARAPQRIILITVDTLRADALSSYRPQAPRTTAFDQLAQDGMVFEHARSPAPWTLPSLASISERPGASRPSNQRLHIHAAAEHHHARGVSERSRLSHRGFRAQRSADPDERVVAGFRRVRHVVSARFRRLARDAHAPDGRGVMVSTRVVADQRRPDAAGPGVARVERSTRTSFCGFTTSIRTPRTHRRANTGPPSRRRRFGPVPSKARKRPLRACSSRPCGIARPSGRCTTEKSATPMRASDASSPRSRRCASTTTR
jgi:hypothetical protein